MLSSRWRRGGGAYHGQYIFLASNSACAGERADNEAKIAPKSIGGLAWRGEVTDQGICCLHMYSSMYLGLSLLVVTATFHDLSTREKYLGEIVKPLPWPKPFERRMDQAASKRFPKWPLLREFDSTKSADITLQCHAPLGSYLEESG